MKKKILRITESDLHNIVRNVIKEICEIDDMKYQSMGSDYDMENAENIKSKQMSDDWREQEMNDMYDKTYFDMLYDDNYVNDFNSNVNDYWKSKENLPF